MLPKLAPRPRVREPAALLAPPDPVFPPDVRARELRLEGREPRIVERGFAALDELPRARVVRPLLDRVVDVADGYAVLELVVEDGLEGGKDLGARVSSVSVVLWRLGFQLGRREKGTWTYHHAAHVEEDSFWGCHFIALHEEIPFLQSPC